LNKEWKIVFGYLIFLKEVLQENSFLIKLSNRLQKVLNPCEFPIISSKTKANKIPPKFDKILGCYIMPLFHLGE
jgi:hypothetical protein